jgi:uncharacterized alkaline shock family protein YloU
VQRQAAAPERLQTENGRTTIADAAVAKIAGVATREVSGVYNMGKGAARTFGGIREHLPGASGPSYTQGVAVEVGDRQAAVDLDIVVEYGASIPDVADGVRRNVMSRVEGMTGLEVVEVNIAVDDVAIDDELEGDTSRVE